MVFVFWREQITLHRSSGVCLSTGSTHHTEVQILINPLLAVLELLVQSHDVEGVQGVHDGGPQLGITCKSQDQINDY